MTSDNKDDNGELITAERCRKGQRRFAVPGRSCNCYPDCAASDAAAWHDTLKACEDLHHNLWHAFLSWAWKQRILVWPHTHKNYCSLYLDSASKEWQCLSTQEQLNCPSHFMRNQGIRNITSPRYICSQELVFCFGTNESQRLQEAVAAEALDYMQKVARQKVSWKFGRHNHFTLNMDQTPTISFT